MNSILLLEYEPLVMRVLRFVLLRAGYSLIEARSAEQALQRSAESNGNIALIIADVTPPCSGIGVSLIMQGWIPRLKVLLTSGLPPEMWSAEDAILLTDLHLDSVKIFQKPFTPSDLLSAVGDLIGPSAELSKRAAADYDGLRC
jgi:CheY-like chemotaxis protein